MPRGLHPRPPVAAAVLNGSAESWWTNLGYWSGGDSAQLYSTAALELARRVGLAAQLCSEDVVVDYACGYGDSLRLWVEEFGVRRVVGVEPDPSVCEVVQSRVNEWGLRDRIHLRCANAEESSARALDPSVTAVVCVDAAYHFRTRARWLRRVASALPQGGRVAFADLLWTSARPIGSLAATIATAMRVEPQNLVSEAALLAEVRDCGLEVLATDRCGAQVLDGFVKHAPSGALAISVTRWLLRRLRRSGELDYAVTAAIQPMAPRSAIRG